MRTSRQFEVAIVGAGPAGSSCAIVLARAGISVVLLDKARFPRPKICGNCLNPGIWPLLGFLEVESEFLSLRPETLDSVSIALPNGNTVEFPVDNDSVEPFVSCSRRDFDECLVRKASQRGAVLLEEETVLDAQWKGHWMLSCRRTDVSAMFLVAADGRNSRTAHLVGAYKSGRSHPDGRVGVQWTCPRVDELGQSVQLVLFKNGYGGIVNHTRTLATVALVTNRETAGNLSRDFSLFYKSTIGSAIGPAFSRNLEPSEGVATASPIDPMTRTTDHPAAFLVGDAHRTVEPFTGEGVLFSIRDGIETGTRIARRLRRDVPANPRRPENEVLLNRISTRVLRRPRLANSILTIGSHMNFLSEAIGRMILRQT